MCVSTDTKTEEKEDIFPIKNKDVLLAIIDKTYKRGVNMRLNSAGTARI